jgi:hypothetical protein
MNWSFFLPCMPGGIDDLLQSMVLRVEASNDRADWKPVPKPPLGEVVLLHQRYENEKNCLYCAAPESEWAGACAARYSA